MHLHVRGARATLTTESGMAMLEYQIYQPNTPGNDQVGDGAVAVSFNIMRELCGADWKPVEVRFAHRKPEDITPYRHYFQADLSFDTEQYAVVFNRSWLNRPVADASPELLGLLQREVNKLEVQQGANFLDHMRSLLRQRL